MSWEAKGDCLQGCLRKHHDMKVSNINTITRKYTCSSWPLERVHHTGVIPKAVIEFLCLFFLVLRALLLLVSMYSAGVIVERANTQVPW